MSKRRRDSSSPIVCDYGSGSIKLGFASDLHPRIVKPNTEDFETLLTQLVQPAVLAPHNGQTDFADMSLLICVEQKKSVSEFCFEKLNFSNVAICSSAPLVLAARGATTGLVIDAGHEATRIVPVCEGYVQKNQVKRLDIAGSDVSRHLMDLMKRRDARNSHLCSLEWVEQLKKEFCFIAKNPKEEEYVCGKSFLYDKKITLPDGTCVVLSGQDRYLCGEILFQPKQLSASSELAGVADLVHESVESCALDLRAGLYRNMLLSGGTTAMKGFAARLRQDLSSRTGSSICIDQDPEAENLAFRGGCVLAMDQESSVWTHR